jgi:hypothetical protein
MKITDLEATLRRIVGDRRQTGPSVAFADAQCIDFLCPQCFVANGGPVGTHLVRIFFADRGVFDDNPRSPLWSVSGTCLADLMLSPSIDLAKSCGWHGWIRNGEVTTC